MPTTTRWSLTGSPTRQTTTTTDSAWDCSPMWTGRHLLQLSIFYNNHASETQLLRTLDDTSARVFISTTLAGKSTLSASQTQQSLCNRETAITTTSTLSIKNSAPDYYLMYIHPQLSPNHSVQDPSGLQLEDLQQPGVRRPALPVRQPRLRGGVRVDQDVHHQDVLRQGLGRWIPPAGRDVDSVLDRGAPSRTSPVAGQGVDADGKPPEHHLLRLLVVLELCAWSPMQVLLKQSINSGLCHSKHLLLIKSHFLPH